MISSSQLQVSLAGALLAIGTNALIQHYREPRTDIAYKKNKKIAKSPAPPSFALEKHVLRD
jgi:hypothetical protein